MIMSKNDGIHMDSRFFQNEEVDYFNFFNSQKHSIQSQILENELILELKKNENKNNK